jgi:endonuclease/exonuclease/phosphatase family metal-dependent hydrolase
MRYLATMSALRFVLSILPVALMMAWQPLSAQSKLSVGTYNIRYDNPTDTLKWHERTREVADAVRYYDIVGLQEVLPNQWDDLRPLFPFHESYGRGRDADGGGEACPIFYDRNRFDFLHGEVRWLAPSQWDVPGAIGWDASLPRIATIVLLNDRDSGKRVRVINVHLSHVGEMARAGSSALLSGWAGEASPDEVTIVLGDFNELVDSASIQSLLTTSGLEDVYTAAAIRCRQHYGTYTTFLPERAANAERIDHIFVRGAQVDWTCAEEIIKYGVFVSDHMPVHAELSLR